jgi:hypothetical protein
MRDNRQSHLTARLAKIDNEIAEVEACMRNSSLTWDARLRYSEKLIALGCERERIEGQEWGDPPLHT